MSVLEKLINEGLRRKMVEFMEKLQIKQWFWKLRIKREGKMQEQINTVNTLRKVVEEEREHFNSQRKI